MGALLGDLRYSLRILKKSPGFAAIAIVTLALGIGANSTIFSWINSTLLNPIPGVTHTSDLVTMTEGGTARAPIPFSYLDYMDLRNRSRSFSGMIVGQFPTSHLGNNAVTLYPLWRAPFGANAYMYILLPMLMAIAGVVLLLACANVANLMLVKSVSRRREIAICLSIGASRSRLIRQLLVESLVLSLAGGVLAMFLTAWTTGTLGQIIPPTDIPVALNIPVDRTVLFVTLAISIITGVVFGILPALRASDMSPVSVLKEEAGSASLGLHRARLSSALVVAQISLSLFLLVSAGLFIRSFRHAQQFNAGFNPDHVLLASYSLLPAGYSQARGLEFHRQLLAKLEALPGVESVTLSSWVPLGYTNSSMPASPEGYVPQPHESMEIASATVGPNYLRTMEIPLAAGREFTAKDTDTSQPVAIVNQKFAERYWPHQSPLGKRIFADGVWFTVVGLAHNANYNSLNETPQPFFYLPTFQDYDSSPVIHARVSGNPLTYTAAVEKAIHSLDADLPVYDVSTLKSRVQVASTGQRIAGTFVGAFGLLALLLAAVGIYGVVSYSTRQRSHEIGIRMALGAQQSDVFRLVLGQGLRMIVAGLAIGLLVSFALTRFMRNILFGIGATDAVTFAAVAILLSVVALLACYIPARRAMRVDPMVALRYE